MPIIRPKELKSDYDVVVVGSGAAGGQAAYTLAMEGAKVLILEAGRNYDPARETPMFQTNGQAPLRGISTPDKPYGFYDATVNGGWNVPGEPYTQRDNDPARHFMWWRSRMLGGRTNHWSRVALRNGPYDFKPRSRDGLGFNWPISYEDLEPYYEKVELLIGVYGGNENWENTPKAREGVLLPPPKLRVGEQFARSRLEPMGIPVLHARRAVLTRALDAAEVPRRLHPRNPTAQRILTEHMAARAPCFWATPCERGCSIKANYQSITVHLPPAFATGNLDLVTDAMVRSVELNTKGRAESVVFIDKATGMEHRARGRVIVLAASAYESVRLLFNSKSPSFPEGLGNSSGKLGRYIMSTVGSIGAGQIPALENMPPHNEDGAGGHHAYIPWWLYGDQAAARLNFPRGYHIEFGTGRGMPSYGTGIDLVAQTRAKYGAKMKEEARRYYGSHVFFSGRGEMIPNESSFCELDPTVKDAWGVPVLRFNWKWSPHELRQAEHMQKSFRQIVEAMGGHFRDFGAQSTEGAIQPGGRVIHEVGGAMMGDDKKRSVLNKWGQTWDVPNVFVADGASFCSSADKNPTLTILALAWRQSEYILEQMRRGEI